VYIVSDDKLVEWTRAKNYSKLKSRDNAGGKNHKEPWGVIASFILAYRALSKHTYIAYSIFFIYLFACVGSETPNISENRLTPRR
jgi:hypothetical protein